MSRIRRIIAALLAGVMATFGESPEPKKKTYTLVLFSPDGAKTRRRQLRTDVMIRRYIRWHLGVKA